jgi:hypothetical protein
MIEMRIPYGNFNGIKNNGMVAMLGDQSAPKKMLR